VYKVLIADNNAEDVKILKTIILSYFNAVDKSVAIDVVDNGLDVLYSLSDERLDILFLDIGIPKIDSFEVVRSIRLKKIDIQPVIFMITDFDSKELMKKSFLSGVDWYVIKPFEIQQLELVLNDVVAGKLYLKYNKSSIVPQKISAREFMSNFFLELSVDKLDSVNDEIINELNNYVNSYNLIHLKRIAELFKKYSEFLNIAKEFQSISLAIYDLSELIIELDVPIEEDFFVDFMFGLVYDLQSWCRNIFIEQSAIDVNYLDESLMSSIMQLRTFLKPEIELVEDEVEFF